MIVEVTTEDIEDGTPAAADRCPIALAILRKRGVRDVYVNDDEIVVMRVSTTDYYQPPTAAAEFVNRFDREKDVQPLKFEATRINSFPQLASVHLI